MDKQTVVEVVKDMINKLKLTIDCKVEQVGVIDFFTKSDLEWGLATNEMTGELELKVVVKGEKPDIIEVTVTPET